MCDSLFHLEILIERNRIGFIIIDGNGIYIAVISEKERECLEQWEVQLPKKHLKDGQSSV